MIELYCKNVKAGEEQGNKEKNSLGPSHNMHYAENELTHKLNNEIYKITHLYLDKLTNIYTCC
jgi:hypothetical protein